MTTPKIPHNPDSTKPIRLWNANERKQVPYRFYASKMNAHWGAIKETRWAEIGTTIEIIDCRNGRELGQYTRKVSSVAFSPAPKPKENGHA